MANTNNAKSANHSSTDTQQQGYTQGSNTSSPLSRQWLFAKPEEAKPGNVVGGSELGPYPGYATHSDSSKSSANGEKTNDTEKRKDVFRPSVFNKESSHRWREERDTSSALQKEWWRESDKGLGDTRKMERWTHNSSRNLGEPQHASSERWTDSSSRENSVDQRREGKWSTRWGPDNHESKSRHENYRDVESPRDKGLLHLTSHGKEEKDAEHRRPWRSSNSVSHGSERGEPSFGYSRTHGETTLPTTNHGRVSSGASFMKDSASPHSSSIATNKVEGDCGEYSPLRYSRMQLLSVYRTTNLTSLRKPLDSFIDVPSLTQEKLLEPLALSAPTSEEMVILKGIDNGEVVTSDAPQVSKDGSVGRNSTDMVNVEALKENGVPHKKSTESPVSGEVSAQRRSPALSGTPWRSRAMAEQSHGPSHEVRPRSSEGWSQLQDGHGKWEVSEGFSSDLNPDIPMKPSGVLGGDMNAKKCLVQTLPEELSLYYKDPQGAIQGPFSGSNLMEWFDAGFFGIDLEVRPADASPDTPFSSLGDVIPQLRAKARPPPGFSVPKQSEAAETSSVSKFDALGKLHASSPEVDFLQNGLRDRHESLTEAEIRVLESLISGRLSNSSLEKLAFSEGLLGYTEKNSVGKLLMGVENGNDLDYQLAKKLLLEQQMSLSSPHAMTDSPHQISHPQNVDVVSILQGNAEKLSLPASNKRAAGWSLPGQGGVGTCQDMMETNHNQQFHHQAEYCIQQLMPQSQNQSSFANTLGQNVEHSSNLAATGKLLSSVLPQDQNILKVLQEKQQQLLLEQQQKILQQQQQYILQQQQLLLQQQLLRQQEQQKLSEVLPDCQSRQHIGDSSGPLRAVGIPPGSVPIENPGLRAPHEMFRTHSRMAAHTSQDASIADVGTSQVPKDAGYIVRSEASAPHQFFESTTYRENWNPTLPMRGLVPNTSDVNVKGVEVCKVMKVSEKKSKKHKSPKAQTTLGQTKVMSNTTSQLKQSQYEGRSANSGDTNSRTTDVETIFSDQDSSSLHFETTQDTTSDFETTQGKAEPRDDESMPFDNTKMHSGHGAWKPAPLRKPKSLLEIQLEEQCKAKTKSAMSGFGSSLKNTHSSPWTGWVSSTEIYSDVNNHRDADGAGFIWEKSENASNLRTKKSHLHDLLAEEVLAKSADIVAKAPDNVSSPSLQPLATKDDSFVDDADFVEAKDTKKKRKKSAKGKAMGVKSTSPANSVDVSVSFLSEKGNDSHQEQEVLPSLPSNQNLGDFVHWKGEAVNHLPPPAWSTDSGKLSKPTSLRDIQKEQQQRASSVQPPAPMPTTNKVLSNRVTRESGPTLPPIGFSPSNVAPPIEINALASAKSKSKVEDDLFWGPPDQSNQQSGFPSLNSSIRRKQSNSVKGPLVGLSNREKCLSNTHADNSLSEAMQFRAWCENEIFRLTGSNDTNLLETCLKRTTQEAKILLEDNLGSYDPNHKFIDNFLNYKELLSADELEIAFQPHTDQKTSGFDGGHIKANIVDMANIDANVVAGHDGPKEGGKKKGKKGKKVSASVLGFNVVSNRIMMGEIQKVEN
ncbi:Gyf domain-containing protein [Thalictrum thalictroides]|uniref:Gyf domain-containing protein n=1 Tax=Thalictrum thalictroides TaxID=46969 RepID=A0A7J6VMQ2_THATH|nr:Gyf domain-containing protein [Thalictrum thalictroides]